MEKTSKTVLVTGGTGFLGSHLIRVLKSLNYKIILLKRSFSNTFRVDDLLPNLVTYNIDQCDLEKPFLDFPSIYAIIHLATDYGRERNTSPTKLLKNNVEFPLTLLEYAIKHSVPLFINTDSYFNKKKIPYSGLPLYSLSKYSFLKYAEQAVEDENTNLVTLRLEHVYGEQDNVSKFVNFLTMECLANRETVSLTSGKQKLDFVYVDDVVSAYVLLLTVNLSKFHSSSKLYEVGTGTAIELRAFVEMVHFLSQSTTKLCFGAKSNDESEIIMFSEANISSLKVLGWSPTTPLRDGLIRMIAFHKATLIS